jgi:hypothetical protein
MEIKMKYKKLNSVGSIIDTETKMVYPQKIDNTPDLNFGVHLEDCTDEWYDSLDNKDEKVLRQIVHS